MEKEEGKMIEPQTARIKNPLKAMECAEEEQKKRHCNAHFVGAIPASGVHVFFVSNLKSGFKRNHKPFQFEEVFGGNFKENSILDDGLTETSNDLRLHRNPEHELVPTMNGFF